MEKKKEAHSQNKVKKKKRMRDTFAKQLKKEGSKKRITFPKYTRKKKEGKTFI